MIITIDNIRAIMYNINIHQITKDTFHHMYIQVHNQPHTTTSLHIYSKYITTE